MGMEEYSENEEGFGSYSNDNYLGGDLEGKK